MHYALSRLNCERKKRKAREKEEEDDPPARIFSRQMGQARETKLATDRGTCRALERSNRARARVFVIETAILLPGILAEARATNAARDRRKTRIGLAEARFQARG